MRQAKTTEIYCFHTIGLSMNRPYPCDPCFIRVRPSLTKTPHESPLQWNLIYGSSKSSPLRLRHGSLRSTRPRRLGPHPHPHRPQRRHPPSRVLGPPPRLRPWRPYRGSLLAQGRRRSRNRLVTRTTHRTHHRRHRPLVATQPAHARMGATPPTRRRPHRHPVQHARRRGGRPPRPPPLDRILRPPHLVPHPQPSQTRTRHLSPRRRRSPNPARKHPLPRRPPGEHRSRTSHRHAGHPLHHSRSLRPRDARPRPRPPATTRRSYSFPKREAIVLR